MTDTKRERRPRRDANGRLATIGDLAGTALAGLVTGVVLLLLLEAVLAITHVSEFGHTNGWLTMILPVWLFTEEFRAVGFGYQRVLAGALAAGFGVATGLTVASVAAPQFPVLASGIAGAAACTIVYCLVWFYGLRWLDHPRGR